MSKNRIIAKWFALLVFIVLGMIMLNYAAFSAWVSYGPPNNYPHAWAQQSLIYLGYSLSLFLTGIFIFLAFKADFSLKTSRLVYLFVIAVIFLLLYPKAREYILVDECLDNAGRWDKAHFECKNN